jgi:hypothetical protein
MADLAALQDALVNAHKAGDTRAAQMLADEIVRQQSAQVPKTATQPAQMQTEAPGLMARVGRGMTDVTDRIAQLTVAAGEKLGHYPDGLGDVMTQQMNDEGGQYEKGRQAGVKPGEKPGIDWARMGGNAAMQAPLALMSGGDSLLGQIGMGAVQGGASGALQYDPTNTLAGTLKNTATGAVTGAVLNPVTKVAGNKAGEAWDALKGRAAGVTARIGGAADPAQIIKSVPEVSVLPEQQQQDLIAEAAQQIKATGNFDAEALKRKANLLANGVTPTKAMVTRKPQDWAIERNLSKLTGPDQERAQIGSDLTDLYLGNDQALTGKLRGMSDGLPAGTQEAHGMTALKGVDQVAKDSQAEVSKAYGAVHGEDVINPPPNALVEHLFSADLQDIEDPSVKTVIKTVENRLKRNGIVKTEPSVGPDGSYNYELTGKGMTAKQTEELRKLLSGLDAPNSNSARVKGQLIRALDESITREGGQDVYGAARSQAAERFGTLDNPATQRALDTFGELQQGKTAQNFIKSQVIDAADQDVQALVKTLGSNKEALDAMQAGVLKHLESKAVNPNSGQFSGAKLSDALREIGDNKLTAILGPEKAAQLKSLAQAGVDATYQPAYSAVNSSNTAPMLLSLTRNVRKIPLMPNIVTDELQRSVEVSGAQKQLANALLAKGEGTLPQSPQMRRLIEALQSMSAPASVTTLDQRRKAANQ